MRARCSMTSGMRPGSTMYASSAGVSVRMAAGHPGCLRPWANGGAPRRVIRTTVLAFGWRCGRLWDTGALRQGRRKYRWTWPACKLNTRIIVSLICASMRIRQHMRKFPTATSAADRSLNTAAQTCCLPIRQFSGDVSPWRGWYFSRTIPDSPDFWSLAEVA
jgi:hypothetical protein